MKILGIDYGRAKIGVSVGDTDSKFAEPLSVIKLKENTSATEKIGQLVKVEKAEKIVVGESEGKMAQETKDFGLKLHQELGLPVEFQDETLTTYDAQKMTLEAGIKRKKRRELEDAYSASIMLQSYLDSL